MSATTSISRRRNALLWTVQGLVAAVFLFAGGMKPSMPVAVLAQVSRLPGSFMKFIAVAELVGAVGLVLPGLLRIKPGLTPLAAACLVIIMIGAHCPDRGVPRDCARRAPLRRGGTAVGDHSRPP